ncbi:MAG: (E)-4-hydroxy-3-methylbut-2-enyl-diphosphate synthase, partial [Planctomycetota bacterium]
MSMDRFGFSRRRTRAVRVGAVTIGGDAPILVQSMCTTPTLDVAATVAQALHLCEAGCALVRVTAPGLADARALRDIRAGMDAAGWRGVPICADIHFMPKAAMEAVEHVEKVRINPGNYADKKVFAQRDYSDAEYAAELERVRERFLPLVRRVKQLGRAMRIGTNHGSLSDRIMNRHGDSPTGMVASAEEFIAICEDEGFRDIVVSMKSSNPTVMVQAYRLLVRRFDQTGRDYPLHLGVTEAGGGEDGRCKGAAGIGALLEDGIGDTIRVSLTEDPVREIPVAQALVARYAPAWIDPPPVDPELRETIDPCAPQRRIGEILRLPPHPSQPPAGGGQPCGGGLPPRVLTADAAASAPPLPDVLVGGSGIHVQRIRLTDDPATVEPAQLVLVDLPDLAPEERLRAVLTRPRPQALLGIAHPGALGHTRAYRLLAAVIEERFRTAEATETG